MKLLNYVGQTREVDLKKLSSRKLVKQCPDSKGCAK